jgi:hypothetical protein
MNLSCLYLAYGLLFMYNGLSLDLVYFFYPVIYQREVLHNGVISGSSHASGTISVQTFDGVAKF